MSYVLAVDQGTSSSRAVLINCDSGEIVYEHNVPLPNIYPAEGWAEICPQLILDTTNECIDTVVERACAGGISLEAIAGVGITNQRETTLVWEKSTGKPLYNAIVWLDNRTNETVKALVEKTPTKSADHFKAKVGLPISPYFSAVKLRWLLDNVPETAGEDVLFGTVDTWLIWNLTGRTVHVTDVTNASRTMLMNLETLNWDGGMCEFFGVRLGMLPEIRSSGEVYGKVAVGRMAGKPIAGCLGDQQAALYGQHCTGVGQAKCTYGTGCFMLSNTGPRPVHSSHGLLTTVAYQMAGEGPVYALEGAVAIGGEVVRWLRDSLGIISSSAEIEELSNSVDGSHDLYFVPAFSGLYAPYWDPTARGLIIGITAYSSRGHLARAALEAVCYQVGEIVECMEADSGRPVSCLRADGGMTKNSSFLQLQADILGTAVESRAAEATALGAGVMAARTLGVWRAGEAGGSGEGVRRFEGGLAEEERQAKMGRWKEAVKRSRGWVN